MKFMRLCAALSVLSFATASANAQVLYGTVVGTVTDPSQGAVAGADVTITNKATNYTVSDKTDDRGGYNFANVPPGTYQVKIVMAGFATFDANDIAVQPNNITRVDAQMKVGNVSEVITVGAEVAQLQTDKSDLHTDIGTRELTNIAVAGYRNFQSIVDFIPGTTPATFQNASTDSPARALTANVNGTARNSNNLRIDGAASVFTWLPHHAFYIPPMESIEVVNVATNNFDAEQGMAGGAALSVITKSGTNSLHGVGFWYTSNHKWGAKNLFFNPNTPAGPNIPQRIDNQYGGTLGGPIIKDKLFFFGSWEGTTTAERGNGVLSVPTAQVRSGNFAGLPNTTIYDPLTGDPDGKNRTAFAGNVIPDSRKNPAALMLQSWIPLPNQSGDVSNYFASAPYYFKRDMVDGKMDYNATSKMKIFGKYSVMIAPVTSGAPLGQALGGYPGGAAGAAGIGTGYNKTDVFGGGVSYVISPTLLVDGNFGGTMMHHDTAGPDFGTNIGSDVLKIPGTNGSDIRQSGFPIFTIGAGVNAAGGYTSLGNVNNWSPVERNDRSYTYAANVNWTKGAHNLRFGIDLIQHQMNHWQPELGSYSPRGGFAFQNGVTGLNGGASPNLNNGYAAFLLGLPSQMGKAYQFYDPMRTRELQQGYYIRDNWQVNRKLNVNLGLRMEHFPIMNRGEFGIERWDPTTNKVLIGGRGNVPRDAGTEAIPIMWGPRVGFAYRLTEKTVIRAGFGITNDPYPMSRPIRSPFPAVIVDEYLASGNAYIGSLTTGIPAVKFPDISSGIVDIPNSVSTNSLQAGKFRRGYIESFNFTIQREMGANIVITTSYVGTRSIRQGLTYFDVNAGLVPGAGNAGRPLNPMGINVGRSFFIPMATNRYDAWQTNLTKRFSQGLFFSTNFTWSKTIGINAGNSDNGLRFYVPSQYSKNRALADFDRTYAWTSAANWELPFGKGKKWATSGAGAAILGGWALNPTLQWYTGTPIIVTADGAGLNAPTNTQVADQVKETVTKLGGVGVGAPFLDPTAFAPVLTSTGAADRRFGNMGLNAVRGPWRIVSNLGVFRRFDFSEKWNLQFRAEALNWTNTPTLANPNANVSVPGNFMMITSTDANATAQQRTIRFGLRLAF